MAGPAFEPDCCIALPSASIAVMGPRRRSTPSSTTRSRRSRTRPSASASSRTEELRQEYAEDIDILHLASELVVDAVIQPDDLRDELIRRFALAADKDRSFTERRNGVTPV